MLTNSRRPWSFVVSNFDNNRAYIRDAMGKSIAFFNDPRDAEFVVSVVNRTYFKGDDLDSLRASFNIQQENTYPNG